MGNNQAVSVTRQSDACEELDLHPAVKGRVCVRGRVYYFWIQFKEMIQFIAAL